MSWRETPANENQRDNELNETELRDLIRRADKFPDRKGSLRRAAFRRLISLAQSPNPQLKKLVTEKVKDFFVDFPDLQEEAINAVYDLCEDQDQSVRILGYGAIASVSRVAKHWLLRNADVLVQLLQSDDEREVAVVKRALQEHVDLDPSRILQMLCEQCLFEADRLDDEEERALRSRLRMLVIDFLSEKYRGCVARAVKVPEVEKILVRGLVPAIPRTTAAERQKLVYDILIHLPSFGPQSSTEVFDIVLDISRSALQLDITAAQQESRSILKNALPLLHFASVLCSSTNTSFPTPARGAPPATHQKETHLFEFYLSLISSGGLLSGKTLENLVTPSSCIRFVNFYVQAYEKADHSRLAVRANESPDKLTHSLIELLGILSTVISLPDTTSQVICLALRPSRSILRAIHKRLLGTKGPWQFPARLRSDVQRMQETLSSTLSPSRELEGKEYADELPTAEEVAALQKEISETIRSLIEAFEKNSRPTSGENELRIRGQSTIIGSGTMKRRLDVEQGSTTLAANAEQGLSVRGAARLAQGSDAMDVDEASSSNAPPSAPGRSGPLYEREIFHAHKRRRGRNGGTDETQYAAASGAGAIRPQQQLEPPSLLSRLQGTSSSPNTASLRNLSSKQASGSPIPELAARLSPIITNAPSSASPIHTPGSAISLAARLEMPSVIRPNRSALSSDMSLPKGNAFNSHDYSSRRPSERSNVPASAGQPRRRFIRQAAVSLAAVTSESLNNVDDEIKIRGAAQRVVDDPSDDLERRQGLSLLTRLGDGGGGNAGNGGVGAGGHRIRK